MRFVDSLSACKSVDVVQTDAIHTFVKEETNTQE